LKRDFNYQEARVRARIRIRVRGDAENGEFGND
jgi:hypothetical protein